MAWVHNGGLLSESLNIDGADFKIQIWEGFQSSFRNGIRIRIKFQNVGDGVNLLLPPDIPLNAYASKDLKVMPRDAKPLPSGPPG